MYCRSRFVRTSNLPFLGLSTSVYIEVDKRQQGPVNCNGPPCLCYCATLAPTPQGHFEDAEPLCRRALEITEERLGKNHPQYSVCLSNLAVLLREQVKASVCQCTLRACRTELWYAFTVL